jgi:hypothetical protein
MDEPLCFAEFLDASGDVAMVLHKEEINGVEAVNVITPDLAEEKEAYARIYNIKWSRAIEGNWPKPKPMEFHKG